MHVVKLAKLPEIDTFGASLSKILPVPFAFPIFKIKVSVDSTTRSSIVITVTVKVVTPDGMVNVPSPLFITPFENVKLVL